MKLKSRIFYLYVALAVLYAGLTFIPTLDKLTLAQYHLSPTGLRLLYVCLLIPLFFIWFVGFYGYQKLSSYGHLIINSKDGKEVMKLSYGLLALALGFALSSIISSALSVIARQHLSFLPASVIISNYVSALYPLIAFLFISAGARGLNDIAKARPPLWALNAVALVVIALGVVLCGLISFDHQDLRNIYHMSPGILMITLGIPVTFIWFLGLQAVVELYRYGQKVAGLVYRRGWNQVSLGVGAIVVINIALQYLGTFAGWLRGLTLTGLLVLLYVLLLLLIGAFIVIALGAQKLTKIEEA